MVGYFDPELVHLVRRTPEVIVASAAALLCGRWFTYPTVALAVGDGARSWGAVLGAVVVTLVQAAFVVGIVGFLRQRVIVTATGLLVKNVIHTHTISWNDLGGLSAQIIIGYSGDPWQGSLRWSPAAIGRSV